MNQLLWLEDDTHHTDVLSWSIAEQGKIIFVLLQLTYV